jgi:hypothetical protein
MPWAELMLARKTCETVTLRRLLHELALAAQAVLQADVAVANRLQLELLLNLLPRQLRDLDANVAAELLSADAVPDGGQHP